MKATEQPHAPAALPFGKVHCKTGLDNPEAGPNLMKCKNNLVSARNQTLIPWFSL
jgi:hypothetical protein